MSQQKIVVLCGPTASGKTRLGVELALRFGGEIISGDSMQIYRGMDIGTAKPTKEEMRGVVHHMLDIADPTEHYSVARYVGEATACADDILLRGRLPIVVGGTGLYIDALVSGRTFAAFSGETRRQLQSRTEKEGIGALLAELRRIDPERAEQLHESDEKRIIRALEVFYETGSTITEHDRATGALPPRYDALRLGLAFENRSDQWTQIDRRVDRMMRLGLPAEVSALLARGVPQNCTAMQAIGYKEILAAMDEGHPLSEAAAEIALRSRQYAKRQLTWFRRRDDIFWHLWGPVPDFSAAAHILTKCVEEYGL